VQASNQLLSDSAFFALRLALGVILLASIFLVIRRAIHTFVGQRSKKLGRKKYVVAGVNGIILAITLLLNEPIADLLEKLGQEIGRTVPVITQEWAGVFLVGLFHTFLSLLFLLLLIQFIGTVFWFFESRLAARSSMQKHRIGSPAASVYVLKTLSFINRFFRTAILALLIAAFVFEIFTFFRGMRPIVDTFSKSLGRPAATIVQAILNYLPNLGFLAVIGFLGWGLLRMVKFTSHSVADGTLRLPGFQPEWSEPTYKLLRFIIYMFLLMVSLPYLPGAGSQFFQGFSVFVGALVTFGSSGAISNIVSGITLTYTNAFRVGDFIRIGETIGFVREKSLLVTRIVTIQNEAVTIPNGNILSTSILNYTQLAASKGLVLTIEAGIGYDVDWRTVSRLMVEGARKTSNILSDPSPCVWQTNLGDYAVVYQLRAWTDQAGLMFETHSNLRANVLDEFNREGVEIMTPSIFAHRDASDLAIPQAQFPERPVPRGIAVEVKQSQSSAPSSASTQRS
jgi:small-conductance mechanosensitive channel